MRVGRGVDQVPEQGTLAGWPALARIGDVAEPGGARIGQHALGESLDIKAEDRNAGVAVLDLVEDQGQCVVEGEAPPASFGHGHRAYCLESRGDPKVRKVGDKHRAGTGSTQRGHGFTNRSCGMPAHQFVRSAQTN